MSARGAAMSFLGSLRRWRHGPLSIVLAACFVAEWAAGAHFGFGSLSRHVLFWVSGSLLGVGALLAATWVCPGRGIVEWSITGSVLALAFVVCCGLAFGAAHLVSNAAYLVAEALGFSWVLARLSGRVPSFGGTPVPLAAVGLWSAVLAFLIGMGLSHSPYTAFDSLSYHLFFPARWLQEHHLSIIPTPFSDEAQAYQPGNGELWFLWLMLPFHGDFLARIGQLPFCLVGATTVYALAKRLGATPLRAMYAPTFFLIAPTIIEQAVGADVDLIHAVLFLTSVYLGIVAVGSDERRDWGIWGISLGLFSGTKYLALVYLPILLAIPLVRGPRVRALWALPGIAALGLPWYLRNWIVAGSPIYPATLKVAGITLGRGAFTHEAMVRTFMHTTDPSLLLVSAIHAFGAPLALFLVPAGALVLAAIVVRRAWWPAGFVLLATGAVFPLCWFLVGDNTDSRFLLPAVVTSLGLLPLAFQRHKRLNAAIHAVYLVGIAWILVGAKTELWTPTIWYMRDWLPLSGVIGPTFLVHFVLLVGAAAVCRRVALDRGWPSSVAIGAIIAAGVTLAIGADTWRAPATCEFLTVPWSHVQLNYLLGSRWIAANVRSAHIAYTGINLPYPLCGSDLSNVVSYVNIDHHKDWRFHNYARAFGRPMPDVVRATALAVGSGVFMPVASRAGPLDAARPRFERMFGQRGAWITNLKASHVSYLFVSALDPYEIEYVWHNAGRFPIEDEWAKAEPLAFRLVYENDDVRIYQVTLS